MLSTHRQCYFVSDQDKLVLQEKLKYYKKQQEQLQKSILSVARLQERLSYMTTSYLPQTSRVNARSIAH